MIDVFCCRHSPLSSLNVWEDFIYPCSSPNLKEETRLVHFRYLVVEKGRGSYPGCVVEQLLPYSRQGFRLSLFIKALLDLGLQISLKVRQFRQLLLRSVMVYIVFDNRVAHLFKSLRSSRTASPQTLS